MTTIDDSGCLVFNARQNTCPSWPVRIAGMQGLWRYVGQVGDRVEVIGPFFPNNPVRNGGRSRLFTIDKIKYAGKHARPIDVHNVESTAISTTAKRAQRR